MPALWDMPDFDNHEFAHMVTDRATGLKAIIAVHSTHLGPAAGGTRYWTYADKEQAVTDALRLSRGMSYKNAMAGLPLGGGKAVVLADSAAPKTPEYLAAFGRAVNSLGGAYVTAEDVGMSVSDMVAISKETKFISGLPVAGGEAGGDPGPFTAYGVYLGIKAAAKQAFGGGDDWSSVPEVRLEVASVRLVDLVSVPVKGARDVIIHDASGAPTSAAMACTEAFG